MSGADVVFEACLGVVEFEADLGIGCQVEYHVHVFQGLVHIAGIGAVSQHDLDVLPSKGWRYGSSHTRRRVVKDDYVVVEDA